jgi:hypothetical protein
MVTVALVGLAGCGMVASGPAPAAGKGASISVSLKVVPTIRSVTVSPGKMSFGACSGGYQAHHTASTSSALGYPNGSCWVGSRAGFGSAGSYPITVTNSGIASNIKVSGSAAVPSDNGTPWSLCTRRSHPAACSYHSREFPGVNQYMVISFARNRWKYRSALIDTPSCDTAFGRHGHCWSVNGESRSEGLELIGPQSSNDISTSWTVTVTWTPVPS